MARKSRMSMMKRKREIEKAEKAARKRARREGKVVETPDDRMRRARELREEVLGVAAESSSDADKPATDDSAP